MQKVRHTRKSPSKKWFSVKTVPFQDANHIFLKSKWFHVILQIKFLGFWKNLTTLKISVCLVFHSLVKCYNQELWFDLKFRQIECWQNKLSVFLLLAFIPIQQSTILLLGECSFKENYLLEKTMVPEYLISNMFDKVSKKRFNWNG